MKNLLVIFLLITSIASSQINKVDDFAEAHNFRNSSNKIHSPFDKSVKGSPFIHSEYQNINIKGVAMKGKYNAYSDFFEIDNNGKIYFLTPSIENNFDIILSDKKTTYKAFEYKNLKFGFFKVLSKKDNHFLLSMHHIKFYPEVLPKTSFESIKPAKLERQKDMFYIKLSNEDLAIKLPTRKSKFIKVFKSKGNAIKNYIKKERLKLKKEADLIKIFNYYNSIK